MGKIAISLKFKLLIVLVSLTSLMLVAYALLALTDFQSDKLAYVFETSTSQSRAVANQIKSEVGFVIEKIEFFMRGYNYKNQTLHPYMKSLLPSDPLIDGFASYSWGDEKHLAKHYSGDSARAKLEHKDVIIKEALETGASLRQSSDDPSKWVIALKSQEDRLPVIVIASIKKGHFLEAFSSQQTQDLYLLNHHGQVVLGPSSPNYKLPPSASEIIFGEILNTKGAEVFSREVNDEQGQAWLTAAVRTGVAGLRVVSVMPKSAALEALRLVVAKSALFLFLLVCLTIFVSVLSSNRLTASLRRLLEATRRIGQGDFDLHVDVKSKDEIGSLASGFNGMVTEIKRLMQETAEKARMENELQTAQVVQSRLFPESDCNEPDYSIRGYYRPASECAGDWWYYNTIGDKVYLWIGDATGHGVPAALVTSAARSASKIIEHFPDLSLPEIMALMNQAIHSAAKAHVVMTFFLASFDKVTGEFTYCNASHDPPYVIPAANETLKKADVTALIGNNGPRLGASPDSVYQATTIHLKPGDKVICYTDGITELLNHDGKMWGERRFLKTLLSSFSDHDTLDSAMQALQQGMTEHRADAPLNDDVTFFMFHYHPPAHAA